MLYIFVLYTTLSSKWYYVYMYWIAESSGFRANPEIRIRIKILLTEFPDAVLLRRINDAPVHPPSSFSDTLRRSLTRETAHQYSTIDTLFLRQSVRRSPWNLQIFYSCNPCNMLQSLFILRCQYPQSRRAFVKIQNNEGTCADLSIDLSSEKMVAITFRQLISRDASCTHPLSFYFIHCFDSITK